MNTPANIATHPAASRQSFVVSPNQADQRRFLSACIIIEVIRGMLDEAIVYATGKLDFNQFAAQQFNMTMMGHASLNDLVSFDLVTFERTHDMLRIDITGSIRKKNQKEVFVHSSATFTLQPLK